MTVMTYLIPLLWLVYGLIIPIRSVGDRDRHTVFTWQRRAFAVDGENQASIDVQEKGEFRLAKLIGVVCGTLAAFVTPDFPLAYIVVFIATLAPDAFTRKVNAIDYAGHGAEIMHAEALGLIGYRENEIRLLKLDKPGEDVAANLDRMRWLSRVIYLLGRW